MPTNAEIYAELQEIKEMLRTLTGHSTPISAEIAQVKATGGSLLEHFKKKAKESSNGKRM